MRESTKLLYSRVEASIKSGLSPLEVAQKHRITETYARGIASKLGIYFASLRKAKLDGVLVRLREIAPTHTLQEAQDVLHYGSVGSLYALARKNGIKFKRKRYERKFPYSIHRKTPRGDVPAILAAAHAITTNPLETDNSIAGRLGLTREYVGQIRARCRDLGWQLFV